MIVCKLCGGVSSSEWGFYKREINNLNLEEQEFNDDKQNLTKYAIRSVTNFHVKIYDYFSNCTLLIISLHPLTVLLIWGLLCTSYLNVSSNAYLFYYD